MTDILGSIADIRAAQDHGKARYDALGKAAKAAIEWGTTEQDRLHRERFERAVEALIAYVGMGR